MEIYEYRSVLIQVVDGVLDVADLNAAGADGWRAVGVVPTQLEGQMLMDVTFANVLMTRPLR